MLSLRAGQLQGLSFFAFFGGLGLVELDKHGKTVRQTPCGGWLMSNQKGSELNLGLVYLELVWFFQDTPPPPPPPTKTPAKAKRGSSCRFRDRGTLQDEPPSETSFFARHGWFIRQASESLGLGDLQQPGVLLQEGTCIGVRFSTAGVLLSRQAVVVKTKDTILG